MTTTTIGEDVSEDRAWGLVDAAKLNAVGHDGLLEPGDPEHSSTVSGDDTETAEHLLDEPAWHASATLESMPCTTVARDVNLNVHEGAKLTNLRGDNARKHEYVFMVEKLAEQHDLCFWAEVTGRVSPQMQA